MVVPTNTSAPAVFLGLFAHRNAAATQWSAPVAPGGGSAERECKPLRITVRSRYGSSGLKLNGSVAPSGPTVSGIQYPGAMPWHTKQPTNRGFGLPAVCANAVAAGTIASSSGSASAAPAPRRTVRREMCFLVINIVELSPVNEPPAVDC